MSTRSEVRDQISVGHDSQQSVFGNQTPSSVLRPPSIRVALLTGAGINPTHWVWQTALDLSRNPVDFIGSDDLSVPELAK